MDYIPISPFMRPISRDHLKVVEPPQTAMAARAVNKWEILRSLSTAKAAFGLGERELTVLQGLLSFLRDDMLGGNSQPVVFPSNKAICERLNGMACSTMRRHLAKLIDTGLITRRDSPNGKRYRRQEQDEMITFGFDLSPLHIRAEEIARAAEAVREAEGRRKRLRETISLMRRDLSALAEYATELYHTHDFWLEVAVVVDYSGKSLRRQKMSIVELEALKDELSVWLEDARQYLETPNTKNMSSNDVHNEQHYHNSNKDSYDFEPRFRKALVAEVGPENETVAPIEPTEAEDAAKPDLKAPALPLHLVVASCPSISAFYSHEIKHWHQLYAAASHIRPAMGISASAWEEAQLYMGPEQAAVVVVAMLERFAHIQSPGGYLRALTEKAIAGKFSCGPMIMALLSKKTAA